MRSPRASCCRAIRISASLRTAVAVVERTHLATAAHPVLADGRPGPHQTNVIGGRAAGKHALGSAIVRCGRRWQRRTSMSPHHNPIRCAAAVKCRDQSTAHRVARRKLKHIPPKRMEQYYTVFTMPAARVPRDPGAPAPWIASRSTPPPPFPQSAAPQGPPAPSRAWPCARM